jgi:hypothetical protein
VNLASIGFIEPGDQPQQRALPAPGITENRQDLARRQRKRDVVERQHPAVAPAHTADVEAHG